MLHIKHKALLIYSELQALGNVCRNVCAFRQAAKPLVKGVCSVGGAVCGNAANCLLFCSQLLACKANNAYI